MTEVPDPLEPDAYERLPGEPAAAYGYFTTFCQLGPGRKIKDLAEKVKPSRTYLYRLASEWGWKERAAAYDRNEDRAVHLQVRAARVQLARQYLAVSAGMLVHSARYVAAMTPEKLAEMTPNEIARWSKTAVELGRAALGEPDTRIAVGTEDADGTFRPLAGMGDADRRAELGACLEELGARIRAGEMVEDTDGLIALLAGPIT